MFSKTEFAQFPDEKLIQLLSDGHEHAFDYLYVRYRDKLVMVACSRIRDRGAAEELVQEVFTDLWQKRNALFIRNTFAAYIYTAVKYAVLDYIRSQKVKDRYVAEILALMESSINNTEQEIDYNELDYFLSKGISALPEKCREVFRLSRVENCTTKEIAEKLNISPDTAKYHISHALKELRIQLRQWAPKNSKVKL